MVRDLKKNNKVFCTTRRYREVTSLAKIRRFPLKTMGKHGGGSKMDKLDASIDRMKILSKSISKISPNLVISFCSPEAARIAYGLGINHIAFSDSPHATAVMKLSIPYIQKLLIPWVIPKKEFLKYGIEQKNIIHYRAIDASTITKRKVVDKVKLPFSSERKNILIRPAEDQAAYVKQKNLTIPIISNNKKKKHNEKKIDLTRYSSQRKYLKKKFGKKIKILNMSFDGKILLEKSDIFIGSGGTMTAESALLGIPTISYDAVPNFIEKYLVQRKLAIREKDPKKIVSRIEKMFLAKNTNAIKAKKEVSLMEDPYLKLKKLLKTMN